jgi:Response regulator receiver domain
MTHARRPRRGPSRRYLQVTGRRADQGLDPVRIAGQGGRFSRLPSSRSQAEIRRASAVTIPVIVANDQSMVRAGFRMLLTGEQDIKVVAEANNGLEAVAQTRRLNPAVVLTDIRTPRSTESRRPGGSSPPTAPRAS